MGFASLHLHLLEQQHSVFLAIRNNYVQHKIKEGKLMYTDYQANEIHIPSVQISTNAIQRISSIRTTAHTTVATQRAAMSANV